MENKDAHKKKAEETLGDAIETLKTYLIADMMKNVKLFQSRNPQKFLMSLDSGKFYGPFKNLEKTVRAQVAAGQRDSAYDNLRAMEKMMNDCHAETLTKQLLLDDKKIVWLKWILTIILAFGVNYLTLKLI